VPADPVMTALVAGQLRGGLRLAGWEAADLWLASVAIGANLGMGDIAGYTAGRTVPTRREYDILALALNEQLSDLGQDHPIRRWDDLDADPR